MERLLVEGFYSANRRYEIPDNEVIEFRSFMLQKKVGTHSVLEFSAVVKTGTSETFLQRTAKNITVSRSGDAVFRGYIESVTALSGTGEDVINVRAVSYDSVTDAERRSRIFQNTDKTFRDILSAFDFKCARSLSKCGAGNIKIEFGTDSCNDKASFPVMQTDITDFEFARKIAAYCGCFLWVDDISENTRIIIAPDTGRVQISEKNIIRLREQRSIEKTTYFIITDEIIPLGKKLQFSSGGITKSATIVSVYVQFCRGDFIFEYEAVESQNIEKTKYFYKDSPIYLTGEVESFDDSEKRGRVQVSFAESEAEELISNGKPFIDVIQLNGVNSGGLVYIPAKGDKVIVRYEFDRLAVTGVLTANKYKDNFSAPDERYLYNIYDKFVALTKDNVTVKSKDSSIILSDDKAEITIGGSCFKITEDQIVFIAKNSKIEISGSGIRSETNGDASVKSKKLQFETSSDVTVKSEAGRIQVKGSKIDMKGPGGINLN